jgi:UDP-N-acetylmuramate dehydrogenase
MTVMAAALPKTELRQIFGDRLKENEPLGRYTSARIGGSADLLVEVKSADDLADALTSLWELDMPFITLGGGSNVLVSDRGVRELVLLNRAKALRFDTGYPPKVLAESGVGLGTLAREAASRGLSGLEWAAGIPGTLGGAVFGNAGAHGADIAQSLKLATILHREQGRLNWSADDLEFAYRESRLKRNPGEAVVLGAEMTLKNLEEEKIRAQMDTFLAQRRQTQPPGASIGSMFKNPDGDFAGRLIEAGGMKGMQIGEAQISPLHANFFLNAGKARSQDVFALIMHAREKVAQQFGVNLELEIQLLGDWPKGEGEKS